MTSQRAVTEQYLLEGACYALEQCGILLNDAATLCRNGSYPSAIVMAAFAQEELGRCLILRNLREEVIGGKTVTIKRIKDLCEDHVRKQESGQLSTTIRAPKDSTLGTLIRTRMATSPESEEYKEASAQLERVRQQVRKRAPSQRHETRELALYVGPDDSGFRWSIPRTRYTKEHALPFVSDAMNDYSTQYQRTKPEYRAEDEEDEFFRALQQWNERPEFLPPPFGLMPP